MIGTASDVGGDVVLVEVSTDGGATWQPATGYESWTFVWTPGAPGSVDLLSRAHDGNLNPETPGTPVSVTILPQECPCSLWSDAVIPTITDVGPGQPVELGVKFRAEASGYITALRFYKSAANIGTHVGNLWSTNGTLLGSVIFAAETPSGWQEEALNPPVPIVANTTYIASYHTAVGHYAFDVNYFASSDWPAPPLRALADGEDGPNGVYLYSPTSGFPTSTYQASNYWVDVVFNETAEDLQPPVIVARYPAANGASVPVAATITATFNEAIDAQTLSFELRDAASLPVSATVSYDAGARRASLLPDIDLDPSSEYTATVSGVEDLQGNAMPTPDSWSFTTADLPLPPPDEGPGGPILVIADAADPFGRYYAEILRCEGLNAFTVTDISLVDAGVLADHDVVILAQMALAGAQVTLLTDWVNAGGNLIAMRPDTQLEGLLGLASAASTLAEGYLLVDTGSGPGVGIVAETMQYHGSADLYTLSGATALATLYSDATTPTSNPALTLRDVGGSGGQAACFAYDLARSVIWTRQGNPAWEGQDRDSRPPIRPNDLFYGGARARLGGPEQGRHPPGRRAAAPAREPDPADECGSHALAALLVLPERSQGRGRHDRRRPQRQRHRRALRSRTGSQPGRLLGG